MTNGIKVSDAMHAAQALLLMGCPVVDCLAGYGKILKLIGAKYVCHPQTFLQRLLRRPRVWWAVEIEYLCTGDGKPFRSFGMVYPNYKLGGKDDDGMEQPECVLAH